MTDVWAIFIALAGMIVLVAAIIWVSGNYDGFAYSMLAVALACVIIGGVLFYAFADERAAEKTNRQNICTSQGYIWTQDETCFNKDGYRVVIP